MAATFQSPARVPARPQVSFLVPNIGGPSLGFATAFARAVAAEWPVQVVGPDIWGIGVAPIYRDCLDYTVVQTPRLYRYPEYWLESRRLARAVTGDVIFAIKAMPQTVGIALREKRRRGVRVVVCLDEWDGALMARRTPAERRAWWRKHWLHPLEENYYPRVERMLPQADQIVSTSSFLQRRFGGVVVRMGADTERFRPLAPEEKAVARAELGIAPEQRVIVFGGMVRPHKGVELILEAMAQAADPALRLLVIGPVTETLAALMQGPQGSRIIAAGQKPSAEMPHWLGAGDLTVLPMKDDQLAHSQVPCKVFEAMAMGQPVLAGAVSDLPEIVSGAGAVFPSGDARALAGLLRHWRQNPGWLDPLGREARRKCEHLYSAARTRQDLTAVLTALTGTGPSRKERIDRCSEAVQPLEYS